MVAEYRQMAIELYQQFATKPTAQPMATPRENPDKVWIPVKQYFDKFCPVSDETAGLWTRAALSVLRQGDDSVRFQLQSGPSDWGLMVSIDGQRTIAMPGPNHTEIVKYGAADFNRIRIGLAPYAKDTQ